MSALTIQKVVIPQKLNIVLIGLIQVIAIGSLVLGSHFLQQTFWWMIVWAIVYSFVLQTNYALMHEAMHGILHQNKKVNFYLGTVCSFLFPLPFSLVRVTHAMHHRHNRDPNERFDLFQNNRFSLKQALGWYGILTGVFWVFMVVGLNGVAICPNLLKIMKINRNSPHVFRAIRLFYATESSFIPFTQVLGSIVYWSLIYWLFHLNIIMMGLAALAFAFNWSTRQYIQHAYAGLDKITGAHNLRTGRINGLLLLNGQWDLVHHRFPFLPWILLAQVGQTQPEQPIIGYGQQYRRMWRGPIKISQLTQITTR